MEVAPSRSAAGREVRLGSGGCPYSASLSGSIAARLRGRSLPPALWNRCRPGRSHHGLGLELRRAGTAAGVQISAALEKTALRYGHAVLLNVPVVESYNLTRVMNIVCIKPLTPYQLRASLRDYKSHRSRFWFKNGPEDYSSVTRTGFQHPQEYPQ